MKRQNRPLVKNQRIEVVGQPVLVGTAAWFAWLETVLTFIYEGEKGHCTARSEIRKGLAYWYAYRRRERKLRKVYLGKSENLTIPCLEGACARLAGVEETASTRDLSQNHQLTEAAFPGDQAATEPLWLNKPFLPITRLQPPVLPQNLVSRPRLIQRLNYPLTIIVAPSGFGKSTLMNEWQRGQERGIAWLSLDSEDDRTDTFWQVTVAALQMIDPTIGQQSQVYLPTVMHNATAAYHLVTSLINDIATLSQRAGPHTHLALIYDDFHTIQEPLVQETVQFLVENAPANLQIIMAGNSRSPLALGGLRMRGALSELDSEDLRFTLDEGVALLQKTSPGTTLAFRTLAKRTEGWAAGLNLVTLALHKLSDVGTFMDTFAWQHTYFQEFFMDDVLFNQPPDIQRFLLYTSVLKHLYAPLCDAVTQNSDSEEVLRYLWQENLFITRLEGAQASWYRYHELFAEALRNQLLAQFPEQIFECHRRAAHWFLSQDVPEEAVRHLLAVEAWDEVAQVIEGVVSHELQVLGEDSRLLRWLDQLPETAVHQNRTLFLTYTRLANMALSAEKVAAFLDRLEVKIRETKPAERTVDKREMLIEIDQYRKIQDSRTLSPTPTDHDSDQMWHMIGLLNHSFSLRRRGSLLEGAETARQALEMAREQHNMYVLLLAGGIYADSLFLQGYLQQSEAVCHQILSWARTRRPTLPAPSSVALLILASISYVHNQLNQARHWLQEIAIVDPNPTSASMPLSTSFLQAKIQAAEGNMEGAQVLLQANYQLDPEMRSGLWSVRDVKAYQVLLALRQDDLVSAERWLLELGRKDDDDLVLLAQVGLWLATGQIGLAETALTDLIRRFPHGMRCEPLLYARLLLSLTQFRQNKLSTARQLMAKSIRAAAPENMIRPFLDVGYQLSPLLTLVCQTEKFTTQSANFLQTVLDILQPGAGQTAISQEELAHLSTASSISKRELEVLQLVSQGLSNREIAARLFISPSTVKTHLKNIYRKLEVKGRAQAIVKAQKLGVL